MGHAVPQFEKEVSFRLATGEVLSNGHFKKSLIVEQLQGNYLKLIFNGHEALILGTRLNRDGCGHFLKREAITSFY